MLEIRTLTPNRFENQSSHDCNHQQEFVKHKTVVLHHCGFKLEFPKHFYQDRYFGYTLSM